MPLLQGFLPHQRCCVHQCVFNLEFKPWRKVACFWCCFEAPFLFPYKSSTQNVHKNKTWQRTCQQNILCSAFVGLVNEDEDYSSGKCYRAAALLLIDVHSEDRPMLQNLWSCSGLSNFHLKHEVCLNFSNPTFPKKKQHKTT